MHVHQCDLQSVCVPVRASDYYACVDSRAATVTLHSCGQTRVREENETAEEMSYKEKGRSNKNRLLNEGR